MPKFSDEQIKQKHKELNDRVRAFLNKLRTEGQAKPDLSARLMEAANKRKV